MFDKRESILAHNLINNSCGVKAGQNVLIEYSDCPNSFLECLVKEALALGAYPFLSNINKPVLKHILSQGERVLFERMAKYDVHKMRDMHAVLLVRGDNNIYEYSAVSPEQMKLYTNTYYQPVHIEHRLKKNWVNLRYPTSAFAQSAGMSLTDFEDYYFKVCNLDYSKMCKAMSPLKELMEKTNKVKIIAKDTHLEFSIKGIPAVKCCGEKNIPDGEIYTAPLKHSVNGEITFNIPCMYNGIKHENIRLTFKDGKVVSAISNNTKALNDIISTDSGSAYVGEFAFGINPYITFPINDILFDEKMNGSIHLALGNSYDDAFNGNISSVHWDLIQSHELSDGGGEVYFDDMLVRKNGKFILSELVALNAKNLV